MGCGYFTDEMENMCFSLLKTVLSDKVKQEKYAEKKVLEWGFI